MPCRYRVVCLTLFVLACRATGVSPVNHGRDGHATHDYYRHLKYPAKLVPGVALDKVEQEGGPDAVGYKRRTVQWWPRNGQDIVDVPKGVPLRTWTRNKGQTDKEALAGVCRTWARSDSETFKAHLIGFRGFGIETPDPRFNYKLTPAAVLRMENGERRAVLAYPPFHMMVSQEDHDFIHGIWRKEWKKIQAAVSPDEYISNSYRRQDDSLVLETKHFTFVSASKTQYKTLWWMRPHEPEKQDLYRKGTLEFAENMWAHIEAAGCSSLVLAPDHRLRAKICVRSKSKQSHGRLAKLPKQEISKDSPKKLREMPQLLLPKWFNISRKQRFLQVCIITKLVLSTRSNLVEQKFKMQRTWRTR